MSNKTKRIAKKKKEEAKTFVERFLSNPDSMGVT